MHLKLWQNFQFQEKFQKYHMNKRIFISSLMALSSCWPFSYEKYLIFLVFLLRLKYLFLFACHCLFLMVSVCQPNDHKVSYNNSPCRLTPMICLTRTVLSIGNAGNLIHVTRLVDDCSTAEPPAQMLKYIQLKRLQSKRAYSRKQLSALNVSYRLKDLKL